MVGARPAPNRRGVQQRKRMERRHDEPAGAPDAGPAKPGEAAATPARPAESQASGPNPYAPVPSSDAPTKLGRTRRPTSLRSAPDEPAAPAPRPPVPPPSFEAAASPRDVPTDEPTGSPFDPVFERLATAQERASLLASERPEVVVGVAFAAGLILATILKRLGRR